MENAPKSQNAATEKWLTTLVERAKALDAIFACGGEIELAPASFGEGTEARTDVRVREGRQLYARNGALAVEGFDGRPEPAVALLGRTEYSATDYFGNEASAVSFYAAAAILFDVPPQSARKRLAVTSA